MDDLTKLSGPELSDMLRLSIGGSNSALDEAIRRLSEDTRVWQRNLERERDKLRAHVSRLHADMRELDDQRELLAIRVRELEAQLQWQKTRIAELESWYLRCAQAIGVVYEGDGMATQAGPIEAVERHIGDAIKRVVRPEQSEEDALGVYRDTIRNQRRELRTLHKQINRMTDEICELRGSSPTKGTQPVRPTYAELERELRELRDELASHQGRDVAVAVVPVRDSSH